MTTSRTPLSFEELASATTLSPYQIAYFQGRTRNRVHEAVLEAFRERVERDALTRAELARRLGRRPEQVTRWLASPGNWTLDTVSDLLLALGYELEITAKPLARPQSAEPAARAPVPAARPAVLSRQRRTRRAGRAALRA